MPHEITADDLGWVRGLARTAKQRSGPWANVDDLEGDGLVALVQVAKRYDPHNVQGASFRTYASDRIVGAMIDGLRTWHGTRSKYRKSMVSLDSSRFRGLVNETSPDTPIARRHLTRGTVVDNHDDFELDLTLDGRLTDPADQMIVALLALEGLDKQEVAAVFQVTPAAISHRLARIRQRARAAL